MATNSYIINRPSQDLFNVGNRTKGLKLLQEFPRKSKEHKSYSGKTGTVSVLTYTNHYASLLPNASFNKDLKYMYLYIDT